MKILVIQPKIDEDKSRTNHTTTIFLQIHTIELEEKH